MSPHSLSFRASPNASASGSITISNTGTGRLHANVGAPKHNPPLSELGGGAIEIDPNNSQNVIVVYSPTKKGKAKDQISITSDDPKQKKAIKVKLTGTSK